MPVPLLASIKPSKTRIVVDFPDEDSVYKLFGSPEYQAIAPHRDAAYEKIDVIVTSTGSSV